MTTISNRERYYHSGMSGAPAGSGTAGAWITILDAVLCDGWDVRTINTLVVAGGISTATISAGHLYAAGDVVRVAGVTPAALNGDWRLQEITGSTAVWSVAGLGIADGSATGTMTARRAPAGFEKIFSATGKAAYRSLDPSGPRAVYRFDDTAAQTLALVAYESMTGIDTGTAPFPAAGACYLGKSDAASSAARGWMVIADSKSFALFSAWSATYPGAYANCGGGDLIDPHPSDPLPCAVWGAISTTNALEINNSRNPGGAVTQGLVGQIRTNAGTGNPTIYLPRRLSGAGPVSAYAYGCPWGNTSSDVGGSSVFPVPPATDKVVGSPAVVIDADNQTRGVVPGVLFCMTYLNPAVYVSGQIIGSPGNGVAVALTGRSTTAGGCLLNLGPWS